MTPLAHPLVLWVAALGCVGLAVRARARPVGGPSAVIAGTAALPGLLRALTRVPAPPSLRRLMRRADGEERILHAGLAEVLSVRALERARVGGALGGIVFGLALALVHPLLAGAAAPLAWLGAGLPVRALRRRASARRAAIVRELPDLLDLLELSVEAGMALDPALDLAAERLGGALGAEVQALLSDLAFGMPRRAAYQALVARAGSPELAQAVAAVLQADELGAPLSATLGGQAEALRIRRRQLARERAARAAPKIQLVVALLMVPAALLLVLGVLIIELTRQVGVVIGAG